MAIKCVVLDFDGTFSDVEKEAAPFVPAYKADLFDLFGRDLSAEWDQEEKRIFSDPQATGWKHSGKIMAPATADPFIVTNCVVQNLFDKYGMLKNHDLRTAILQALYSRNYSKAVPANRPEAARVLAGVLAAGLPTYVVTNATTTAVRKKIDELEIPGTERVEVIGDAKKFQYFDPPDADATFKALPVSVPIPGLTREAFVRRGHYYDALQRIVTKNGVTFEELLVCGDIFELDLLLPMVLGARVHLVCRPSTPQYEIDFINGQKRGSASHTLESLLEIIQEA